MSQWFTTFLACDSLKDIFDILVKYAYSLSCQKLDEKIDTTYMSAC